LKKYFQTLLVTREDDILHITLNRPDKRNALNEHMIADLYTVLESYREESRLRGVILSGAGKAFCAGADIAYLQSLQKKNEEENYRDSVHLMNMYWSLYTFPKPTIALVNGPAVAGGCGLSTVCDLIIAGQNAVFAYPEVKIGFIAALVSIFLVQRIGYHQAKKLLITGETLSADEAKSISLTDEVVPEEMLLQAAVDFFRRLKQNSGQAMVQSKNLLIEQWGKPLHDKLKEACKFNTISRQTADFKEGLAAFLEKREAVWSD